MDSAWVTVRLLDVNDNPPLFSRPHAHVTVKEDAAPGTSLATLSARDPDAVSCEARHDLVSLFGWFQNLLVCSEAPDLLIYLSLVWS